jgi:hypothetical protein
MKFSFLTIQELKSNTTNQGDNMLVSLVNNVTPQFSKDMTYKQVNIMVILISFVNDRLLSKSLAYAYFEIKATKSTNPFFFQIQYEILNVKKQLHLQN